MTDTTQSETGAQRETRRFDADAVPFDVSDLREGDRIDPSLVARTMDGLGQNMSARPDAPDAQLALATGVSRMSDVHNAILVDGETGVMVRANRTDSQSAWTQREADWKVRAVGTKVTVEEAEVAIDGNNEWEDVNDVASEAEAWANIVLGDRATGSTDYADELTLDSRSSLTLYEPYGSTKVHATISLSGGE